ncbi:MarR family winged helix-turn-helix transcriptional regulator [Nocardia sp. NPDC051570]|uniref:MarR family winged helix-turn-helix transcriptional regulator n=1 Tax=Nocardia sp. NPDC051570 TaxID=3364324 RepID=UPI00379FE233
MFDGAEITSPELDVMLILRYADRPVIARQLAEQTHRSRAATSKILAKLERRALLSRRPSTSDRRASLVQLTDQGRQVVDELFPRQLAVEARLLGGLDAERRAKIVEGLMELVAELERMSADRWSFTAAPVAAVGVDAAGVVPQRSSAAR